MSDPIVAYHVTDLHLSKACPLARSAEPSWFEAQARPLRQLKALVEKEPAPILCSGDVFHFWSEPAEAINFALAELPDLWSIAGNHDCRNHRVEDLAVTSYHTLAEAGKVKHCDYRQPIHFDNFTLYGFSYGQEIIPPSAPHGLQLQVCLTHQYLWIGEYKHEMAAAHQHLSNKIQAFSEYDVVLAGDNHHGFLHQTDRFALNNGGCLIRRRADERQLRPTVGVIRASGKVERLELDCSADQWADVAPATKVAAFDGSGFLDELRGLDEYDDAPPPSFEDAVHRYVGAKEVERTTRDVLLTAMEK